MWRPARYGTLVLHIIPLQHNLYRKGDPETRIGLWLQCYADIASSKWDAEDCKGKTVSCCVRSNNNRTDEVFNGKKMTVWESIMREYVQLQ